MQVEQPNVSAAATAVVLLGHGSRDAAWREPMQQMALALRQRGHVACCAYLELCAPDVFAAVQGLRQSHAQLRAIVLYPVFVGMGTHMRHDLPRLRDALAQRHADVRFTLAPMLGSEPGLIALVADLAERVIARSE